MFARFFRKPSAPACRPARFVPSVDALEDRSVPTVTAAFSVVAGDVVVTLTGQSVGETVQLFNDGAGHLNATGVVGLPAPGQAPTTAVDKIVIAMGGGNDTVVYNQGAAASPVTLTRSLRLEADLGAGDDDFRAELHGAIGQAGAASSLSMSVQGGSDGFLGLNPGDDTLLVNAGNLSSATDDLDIRAGSVLSVGLDGDGGNDFLRFRLDGELDGLASFALSGAGGVDTVRADVDLDAGSTGSVGSGGNPADVNGNGGADTLRFVVRKDVATDPATVSAVMHGGTGHDTGTFSGAFVDAVSVEELSAV